jgi:hypothetical protein
MKKKKRNVIEISYHISCHLVYFQFLLSPSCYHRISRRNDTYRIIVYILEVYLNLGKADESFASLVLCKHIESPLWTTMWRVSV